MGGVSRRVPDVERRPRQRPLQVDRRRRDLDRDHAQPRHAVRHGRPHRRRADGGGFESRLRAGRKRKRRPVRLGRCGRVVEVDERVARRPPARVLLHARLRRPQQQGHRLHAEHQRSSDRPTAARRLAQIGQNTHGDHHDLWVDPDDSDARRRRQRRRRRDHLRRQRRACRTGARRTSRPRSGIT